MPLTERESLPDGITIRAATLSDAESVSHLLHENELVPLDDTAQFGPQYAVAVDERGRIVGAAGIERYGPDGLLRSVAVKPALQHRGIGAALVRDRLSWAEEAGLRVLYLLTTTAAEYWSRAGFAAIGRDDAPPGITSSREWKSACPASAVAMRLAIQRSVAMKCHSARLRDV